MVDTAFDPRLMVLQFGTSADTAVPADYTGDGKADIAVFRGASGEWYIRRSEDSSLFSFPWGVSGDIPTPGEYDGDGKVDAAIFRPGGGQWWIYQSSTRIQSLPSSV